MDFVEMVKAALCGLASIFIAFIFFVIYADIIEVVPFYVPAATTVHHRDIMVGVDVSTILMVFGAFWSIILVALFKDKVSPLKGVYLGLALWLFLMVVYGPFLGWGFFGFHGAEASLTEAQKLMVFESPWGYMFATFGIHVIYGLFAGLLNKHVLDLDKFKSNPTL